MDGAAASGWPTVPKRAYAPPPLKPPPPSILNHGTENSCACATDIATAANPPRTPFRQRLHSDQNSGLFPPSFRIFILVLAVAAFADGLLEGPAPDSAGTLVSPAQSQLEPASRSSAPSASSADATAVLRLMFIPISLPPSSAPVPRLHQTLQAFAQFGILPARRLHLPVQSLDRGQRDAIGIDGRDVALVRFWSTSTEPKPPLVVTIRAAAPATGSANSIT